MQMRFFHPLCVSPLCLCQLNAAPQPTMRRSAHSLGTLRRCPRKPRAPSSSRRGRPPRCYSHSPAPQRREFHTEDERTPSPPSWKRTCPAGAVGITTPAPPPRPRSSNDDNLPSSAPTARSTREMAVRTRSPQARNVPALLPH